MPLGILVFPPEAFLLLRVLPSPAVYGDPFDLIGGWDLPCLRYSPFPSTKQARKQQELLGGSSNF